jgi:hypothetical protein
VHWIKKNFVIFRCILRNACLWIWPHELPKHVGGIRCVQYRFIQLHACVGFDIISNSSMHGYGSFKIKLDPSQHGFTKFNTQLAIGNLSWTVITPLVSSPSHVTLILVVLSNLFLKSCFFRNFVLFAVFGSLLLTSQTAKLKLYLGSA